MKENKISIIINCSISEVFTFTTNPHKTPLWVNNIVKEEINEQPIKIGTIYKNVNTQGEWNEYNVVGFEKNTLFELKQKNTNYSVRYTYEKISDTKTKLMYHEWVEEGELVEPFSHTVLEKLKEIMEKVVLIIDMNRKENRLAFDEFVLPIVKLMNDKKYFTKHYTELTKEDIDQAEKIILSGTTLKDNDFLKDIEKFSWIKDYNKPILGICAGMHVVGKVFGCNLKECVEIGMTKVEVVKENELMEDSEAYELHGLVMGPNDQFDILAKSQNCIQVVQHKTKAIYGVLFHPEVRNEEMIEKFLQ